VELTAAGDEDPGVRRRAEQLSTLQWHGDSFDLPRGATLLASSPAYPNQAFRYKRAYALQFHLEVTPELAAEWGDVPAYAQSLIQGPGALERLVDEVGAHASSTIPLVRGLFGRWLERVARVPAQAIG
jgi:GMP synthase (glutamine-hydrolysing)